MVRMDGVWNKFFKYYLMQESSRSILHGVPGGEQDDHWQGPEGAAQQPGWSAPTLQPHHAPVHDPLPLHPVHADA